MTCSECNILSGLGEGCRTAGFGYGLSLVGSVLPAGLLCSALRQQVLPVLSLLNFLGSTSSKLDLPSQVLHIISEELLCLLPVKSYGNIDIPEISSIHKKMKGGF